MLNWTNSAEISSTGLSDDIATIKPGGIGYTDGPSSVLCAVCFEIK